MRNQHRGVIPMYNIGIASFFTIAVVFVIIFVNIGFSVNDSQKNVVDDAYDEVREQLEVSGKISAASKSRPRCVANNAGGSDESGICCSTSLAIQSLEIAPASALSLSQVPASKP